MILLQSLNEHPDFIQDKRMSPGYLLSDAAGDAHPVQTRNRLDLLGNQEKRFSCCFRENNMPRLDSLKPGKEHRFDCSFGTQHISILENKIVVAKRDSDHAQLPRSPPGIYVPHQTT